jgi:radical SAM superfamily enzyme YgiQ (UPF0313 family)
VDLAKEELGEGILPMYSFIFGFPGETEEDLDETKSLCKDLADVGSVFSLQILAPNEGTTLFSDHINLIETSDLYREFGESENLSPELRAVFGERLNEFVDALPDFRLVKLSMPFEKFKEKCFNMIDEVSKANESNILRMQRSSTQTVTHSPHPQEVGKEAESRLASTIKQLLKRIL